MPPKHKKHIAHPRDRRNENGLAAPGKQIKKRKSDGALNGHVDSRQSRGGPLPNDPLVATQASSNVAFQPNGTADDEEHSAHDIIMGRRRAKGLAAIGTPAYGTTSRDQFGDSPTSAESLSRPETHNGNDPFDLVSGSPRSAGMPEANTTVITTWSMLDTIAILLILMQLPSSVLTLVNVVFAFITFGSPPTGWSKSSIISTSDWLQSHGGNPSILTMILLDLIFLALWCVAPFGRSLFLGFAQAVVAIQLGGRSSTQPGHISGVLSLGIICCQQYLGTEYCRISLQWLSWLLSFVTSRTPIGPVYLEDFLALVNIIPDDDRSWPRTLLELHIVTQGIIRVIRRAFLRQSTVNVSSKKQGGDSRADTAIIITDITAEGAQNTSTDGRHPGPSPAIRDGREKSVSDGKRRRRQADYVRSQQPFWAAIADAKVTVSREIEQSQASRDSFEAGSENAEQLGTASKHCVDDAVWVSEVRDSDVWFSALLFMPKTAQGTTAAVESPEDKEKLASGVSGALLVRVNGAEWESKSVISGGLHEGKAVMTGKVFGLACLTNYRIELVRARDQTLLHSVSLLTRPDANLEQTSLEDSFRPSSPMSTLQKSITAAEASLNDHRNRSKKSKKDHKSSTNSLRKELDTIESRLSSAKSNDERQRQRQIQYRQNIKQAEDAIAFVMTELENLGDVPESEREAATESKARWMTQSKAHQAARDELDAAKAERDRQTQLAKTESTQQAQKHERLATRLKKLIAQRDALIAAQAEESKEQKRRDATRFSEMSARAEMERSYNANIARLEAQRQNVLEQVSQYEHQVALLESNMHTATGPPLPTYSPDAHPLAHLTPISRPFTTAPPPGFGPNAQPGYQHRPIGTPPVHSRRSSLIAKNRGRSSSMLSTVSAFTDDETDANPIPTEHRQVSHNPSASAAAAANHAMNGHHAHRPSGTSNGFSNGTSMPGGPVRHGSGGSSVGSSSQPGRPGSRSGTASPKSGVRVSPIGAEIVKARPTPRHQKLSGGKGSR